MSTKSYHELHKEEDNARSREYHQEHKDDANKKANDYYWEHREELLPKMSAYEHQHYLENKEEYNAKSAEYYQINKPEVLARTHQYNIDHAVEISVQKYEKNKVAKIEVITHYGNGKCACVRCGFDNIDALTIDHINGDGCENRKKTGTGVNLYNWLKRRNYPVGYQTLCINCNYLKRMENKEQMKKECRSKERDESRAAHGLEVKIDVMTHYGKDGKCACAKCGYEDIRALTIDHINGDGHKHRKDQGAGVNLYEWLIRNNFPDGFQTLCLNCQFIKRAEKREHNDVKAPKYKETPEVKGKVIPEQNFQLTSETLVPSSG